MFLSLRSDVILCDISFKCLSVRMGTQHCRLPGVWVTSLWWTRWELSRRRSSLPPRWVSNNLQTHTSENSKTFCLFFFFLLKTEWLLWSDGDRETQAQCSWDHDRESWCVGWRRWVFNSKKVLRIQCFLSLISSAFPGNKNITFLLTERFRSYTCYFDSTEGGRRTIMWNECGAGRYMRVNVLCQLCVQCYP